MHALVLITNAHTTHTHHTHQYMHIPYPFTYTSQENELGFFFGDENYEPPDGVRILPAPEHFHLPEDCLLTVISKKKFYCSMFEILDTWAELMNPEYYAIFAWSILESVGDTLVYPPQLRLPLEVPSCTNIDNEMTMLTNFNEGQDRRHFLTVPNSIISRVPETLARLAARKKGATIDETQAQRIKHIYEKLKSEGKIYQAASDTDSSDTEARNRRMLRKLARDEGSDGSDSYHSSDEDSDAAARRRAAKKLMESRRIEALDIIVKGTAAADARQRTKFVKDDSLDISKQKRTRGANFRSASPVQQKHTDFLNFDSKKSGKEMASLSAFEKEQRARNSSVVSQFRGPDGKIVSHWQYGSTTLPQTDLLEDDSEMLSFEKKFLKKGQGTNWREAYAEYKASLSDKTKIITEFSNSMIDRKLKLAKKIADAKQKKRDQLEARRSSMVVVPDRENADIASLSSKSSIEARVPTANTKREHEHEPKPVKEHVIMAAPDRYRSFRDRELQESSFGTGDLELNSNGDGGINDMKASRRREKERQIKALSEPELRISNPQPNYFMLADSLASESADRTMQRGATSPMRGIGSSPNLTLAENTAPSSSSRLASANRDVGMKGLVAQNYEENGDRIKIRAEKVRQKLKSLDATRRLLVRSGKNSNSSDQPLDYTAKSIVNDRLRPYTAPHLHALDGGDSRDIDLDVKAPKTRAPELNAFGGWEVNGDQSQEFVNKDYKDTMESWEKQYDSNETMQKQYTSENVNPDSADAVSKAGSPGFGRSWYAPVNVSTFETSTIIGDATRASQINHTLGIGSVDAYSHLTEGFGDMSMWRHGSLGSVPELTPAEVARQQYLWERGERKRIRQMKREHRRAERSYRVYNLKSDVAHVRSTLLETIQSQRNMQR